MSPDVLIKKKNCYFYETTSALHAILYLVVKFLSVTKPFLIRPFFCARSLVHWKTSFWTVQLDRDNQRGWCVPHILTVMQKIKVSTNYNRNMNFKLTKNKKYLIYLSYILYKISNMVQTWYQKTCLFCCWLCKEIIYWYKKKSIKQWKCPVIIKPLRHPLLYI